ncbi:MFS transporter [Niveispirillum fermenti]|uniref:MFS transporter n=1 Tax=Niveispirillum fermenti TaxID=1233113 RepID=UPI003A85EDD5
MMMRVVICGLLVMGTLLGMAGIDLILPAVPAIAQWPGAGPAPAQLVIAAYIGGTVLGLPLFAMLSQRFDRRWLLVLSLAGTALLSAAATWRQDIWMLVAIRFVQGVVASAPAVFAPGIIRRLFDEIGAMRALAALGSIEAIVPGAAPIAGAALLVWGGWQAPFLVTAVLAVFVLACLLAGFRVLPAGGAEARPDGSYRRLLTDPVFLRYALSQSCVLGGLLIFVFGAPLTITATMGGEMRDFIIMQAIGVTLFAVTANLAGGLARRWGIERMISIGTALALFSSLLLLGAALAGLAEVWMLPLLIAPLNIGLGLRGPPGFLRAIMAGRGDDDRASALVILFITGMASGGTALLAPFIMMGLPVLAAAVLLMQVLGMVCLLTLPRLKA